MALGVDLLPVIQNQVHLGQRRSDQRCQEITDPHQFTVLDIVGCWEKS